MDAIRRYCVGDYNWQLPLTSTIRAFVFDRKEVPGESPPRKKPSLKLVQEIARQLHDQDKEDAFYLVDLGEVVSKVETWRQLLPRVQPFYAVKCNTDPAVLRLLAHLGTGFDCASKKEIVEVLELGVEPSRIVYAQTNKFRDHLHYAAQVKVDLMTFDNEEELRKIKTAFPSARLLLRILPPANYRVGHELGDKFGCQPLEAPPLLRTARGLGLEVVGVSFHVGSGVEDPEVYVAAVKAAAAIFDEAQTLGFHFDTLDIGGGFPSSLVTFGQVAEVVRSALEEYFPEERKVRIMAEPGRYLVEEAASLNVTVIGKRQRPPTTIHNGESTNGVAKGNNFWYFLSDGTYGSFSCLTHDKAHQVLHARPVKPHEGATTYVSSLWGPTCDGADKILTDVTLPELTVGDVINFADMGSYSGTMSSTFNGIPLPLTFYYCSEAVWNKLFPADAHTTQPEE